jgi:hypothetical protein
MEWFGKRARPQIRRQFPFTARWHKAIVRVVGYDEFSGHYILADGRGYCPTDVEVVADVQESYPACPESTAIESEPKEARKARGFFRTGQLSRDLVALKATNARRWLANLLTDHGPTPVSAILLLGAHNGHSADSLRRARKHHKIQTFRAGGIAGRGFWLWRLPMK